MSGRPLRFLGGTLLGWIAVRAVMLWPTIDSPAALPKLLIPVAAAEDNSGVAQPNRSPQGISEVAGIIGPAPAMRTPPPKAIPVVNTITSIGATITAPSVAPSRAASPIPPSSERDPIAPFFPPIPGRLPTPRRWSGSAWLLLRNGRGLGSSFGGGQLGGAQTGIRVAYAIDKRQRLAVVGRLTSPLRGTGREAAAGIEWRPSPLPIRLVVEQRFTLDGGKGGPAAGVVAGTGPAPLAFGFDLETYGQAGVIRRDRAELFAEGAARLTRPVVRAGHFKLDLGIGTWGAAQRDAQRLDIGPSIGVTLPIGSRTLRAIGDWRQRVAGKASPGSGPTLTIGADF